MIRFMMVFLLLVTGNAYAYMPDAPYEAGITHPSWPTQTHLNGTCSAETSFKVSTNYGKIVLLSDGSIWQVDPMDAYKSAIWVANDPIVSCGDKLVNMYKKEYVSVVQIR